MRSTDLAISFFTFLTVLANLATVGIAGLALAARWRVPAAVRAWSIVRAELAAGGLGLAWLVAAVCTAGSLWFSEVAGFQPCRLCWAQRACMYPLTLVLAVATWARHNARPSSYGADAATAEDPHNVEPAAMPVRAGAGTAPSIAGPGSVATLARPSVDTPADPVGGSAPAVTVGRRVLQIAAAMAVVGAAVAAYHVVIEMFPSLETGACDPQMPCTVVWFERLGFVTLPYMALSGFVLILALLTASRPIPQEDSR